MVTIEQYFPADFVAELRADRQRKQEAFALAPYGNVVSLLEARRLLRSKLADSRPLGDDAA